MAIVNARNDEITPSLATKLEPALAVISREFRVNPSQIVGVGELDRIMSEGEKKTYRAILCRPGSNDRLQKGDERISVSDMICEIGFDPMGSEVFLVKFVDDQGGVHTANSIAMIRTVTDEENELYLIDIHTKGRHGAPHTIFHLDKKKAAKMDNLLINDHIVSSPNKIHNYFWSGDNYSMGCDSNREWRLSNEITMNVYENPYESKQQARELIEFAQEGFCD